MKCFQEKAVIITLIHSRAPVQIKPSNKSYSTAYRWHQGRIQQDEGKTHGKGQRAQKHDKSMLFGERVQLVCAENAQNLVVI